MPHDKQTTQSRAGFIPGPLRVDVTSRASVDACPLHGDRKQAGGGTVAVGAQRPRRRERRAERCEPFSPPSHPRPPGLPERSKAMPRAGKKSSRPRSLLMGGHGTGCARPLSVARGPFPLAPEERRAGEGHWGYPPSLPALRWGLSTPVFPRSGAWETEEPRRPRPKAGAQTRAVAAARGASSGRPFSRSRAHGEATRVSGAGEESALRLAVGCARIAAWLISAAIVSRCCYFRAGRRLAGADITAPGGGRKSRGKGATNRGYHD
jgi:hypothetical protein